MDLSTTYLGFKLANPVIPGASPMCDDLSLVKRLEDAGAPMIVMHSVFQEQFEREEVAVARGMEQGQYAQAEAANYLPDPEQFRLGPDRYLEQIGRIKRAVKIPVVASLNGSTLGGWTDYAQKIEQAGADALELNIYNPVFDLELSSTMVEQQTLEVVTAVRHAVSLPLAVKLSSHYTALPYFARRLMFAGANGLVLFNRFYQVDIDIERLELRRDLKMSTSDELLPRLRAVAGLAGRINCDLAITGGVHTKQDVIKATMAGANAVQMASALLNNGPWYLLRLLEELAGWLEMHGYSALSEMRGSMSLSRTPNPAAFERGNYMKILNAWESD
jgi:dihydroorotate dehydrogenase (fumarate)